MRTGLILAAGFGSRLAGVSDVTRLKPLTPVAGRPLLLRTLDSLALAGCDRVVTVLGHGRNDIEQAVRAQYTGPLELDFVFNARYDLQNGVSVLAAREVIDGAFVLTMADHVFGDEVMDMARHHTPPSNGATLLVDYKLDSIFDMDDATKVWAEADRIVHIGKLLSTYNCVDTGALCLHTRPDGCARCRLPGKGGCFVVRWYSIPGPARPDGRAGHRERVLAGCRYPRHAQSCHPNAEPRRRLIPTPFMPTDALYILTLLCLIIVVSEWLVRRTFLKHVGTALPGDPGHRCGGQPRAAAHLLYGRAAGTDL